MEDVRDGGCWGWKILGMEDVGDGGRWGWRMLGMEDVEDGGCRGGRKLMKSQIAVIIVELQKMN